MNSSVAFFLWIVAFGIGYWLISFLFSKFQKTNITVENKYHGEQNSDLSNQSSDQTNQKNQFYNKSNLEKELFAHYCELFGLNGDTSIHNIKNKYRELQSKYHPDKVSHLGREFTEVAEQKTRELNEGYSFFKSIFDFK